MSAECAAEGCTRPASCCELMCRLHWYMLSAAHRNAVWIAWGGGRNAGTPARQKKAVLAAIEAVNRKQAQP